MTVVYQKVTNMLYLKKEGRKEERGMKEPRKNYSFLLI